jgi:hypothetical protein
VAVAEHQDLISALIFEKKIAASQILIFILNGKCYEAI